MLHVILPTHLLMIKSVGTSIKKTYSIDAPSVFNKLSKLGLECIPSVGNFISFKGSFSGKELFYGLMKKGVIVRPVDLYDMKDFIRVTIGTEAENLKFIGAIEELL